MSNNKNFFLKKEADKYYERNKSHIVDYQIEPLSKIIITYIKKIKTRNIKVLEIGCGDANRLLYLKQRFSRVVFYGIDPSTEAIKNKKKSSIILKKATADKIPFKKNFFDIIIYGFCLYLVDDRDLFKIICEAERVSKPDSSIIIYDFYSKNVKYKKYKHNKKIFIRKMDYSKIFSWCPYYKIKIFKKFKYNYNEINDYLSIICFKKNLN
jgi:ubiquinone/menaquinone biosynthesis C-methylase UbiE